MLQNCGKDGGVDVVNKDELKIMIGRNIRNERVIRGMSLDELAELMEQSPGFLGLVERGQRGATAHNLLKLADIFGISIDSLFLRGEIESYIMSNGLQKKLSSLISDFSEIELFFIINVVKEFRQTRIQTK